METVSKEVQTGSWELGHWTVIQARKGVGWGVPKRYSGSRTDRSPGAWTDVVDVGAPAGE